MDIIGHYWTLLDIIGPYTAGACASRTGRATLGRSHRASPRHAAAYATFGRINATTIGHINAARRTNSLSNSTNPTAGRHSDANQNPIRVHPYYAVVGTGPANQTPKVIR
eukprot:1192040-Prorocentrum_minimum.AAC.5